MSQYHFTLFIPDKHRGERCPVRIILELLSGETEMNNFLTIESLSKTSFNTNYRMSLFAHSTSDNMDICAIGENPIVVESIVNSDFIYAHVCYGFQVLENNRWSDKLNGFISYDSNIHISNLSTFSYSFYKHFFKNLLLIVSTTPVKELELELLQYFIAQVSELKYAWEAEEGERELVGMHIIRYAISLKSKFNKTI